MTPNKEELFLMVLAVLAGLYLITGSMNNGITSANQYLIYKVNSAKFQQQEDRIKITQLQNKIKKEELEKKAAK